VTEDRIQSLVRGIVGELFVPDNRPRQDQQFGATEACRELELITGNLDAEKQCKWFCFTCSTSCSLCGSTLYSPLGGSRQKHLSGNIRSFQKRF
jgi:hypothetical protein